MKTIAVTIIATALLVFLATVDPLLLIWGSVGLLVWVGLPVGVIACVLLVVDNCRRRSRRMPTAILIGILGCVALVGFAVPLSRIVHERAVVTAKAYPEKVAPLLEAYKVEHGAYPSRLDQLPLMPRLPWLLRRFGYHSDGNTYWFSFPCPGGLIDVWNYSSETHQWHLST